MKNKSKIKTRYINSLEIIHNRRLGQDMLINCHRKIYHNYQNNRHFQNVIPETTSKIKNSGMKLLINMIKLTKSYKLIQLC